MNSFRLSLTLFVASSIFFSQTTEALSTLRTQATAAAARYLPKNNMARSLGLTALASVGAYVIIKKKLRQQFMQGKQAGVSEMQQKIHDTFGKEYSSAKDTFNLMPQDIQDAFKKKEAALKAVSTFFAKDNNNPYQDIIDQSDLLSLDDQLIIHTDILLRLSEPLEQHANVPGSITLESLSQEMMDKLGSDSKYTQSKMFAAKEKILHYPESIAAIEVHFAPENHIDKNLDGYVKRFSAKLDECRQIHNHQKAIVDYLFLKVNAEEQHKRPGLSLKMQMLNKLFALIQ